MIRSGLVAITLLLGIMGWAAPEAESEKSAPPAVQIPFMEEFSNLKVHTFKEPRSNFRYGAGVSPVSFLKSKVYSSITFFQLYYMSHSWDYEVFNISMGATLTGGGEYQSRHFVLRTAPKWRFTKYLSFGPVVGLESVTFPKQNSQQFEAPWTTKEEPFSNTGFVYGLMVSETFDKDDYLFKMNQVVYSQTYSVTKNSEGWEFNFTNPELNSNRKPIEPGMVLMFEFAFLY